jgi:AcrR family transcriptional regulator
MSYPRALPRGRHHLSREAVAESQRERMLDAIVELVATDGYARTTVGGIAAKAGVSRTTFYEQFESKEDCFRAAYDAVAGRLIEAIVAASAGIEDPRQQLMAGINAYLEWCAEHPAAAATFIVEVHTAGPEALEQRYRMLERFCEVIDAYVPDVKPAASMAVVTAIDAMAHNLIRRGKAGDLPKLSSDAQYVAEKLLG